MGAYLIRRLLLVIPTLLGIIIINFAVVQFAPGGPVEQMLAELRGEGRLIGVISHVAALKERIACQIEAMPGSGGRSLLKGPGVRRL